MPSSTSVITASGLGFAWPDGTPVLDDLDLLVAPGRSGLVGVNGAGKSTLLRLRRRRPAPDRRPPRPSPARSATCPRTSPSTSRQRGRRLPRHRRGTPCRAGRRGRRRRPAPLRRHRRRLGRRGPRRRRARPARPARRRARPAARRAVRRRGHPARAGPAAARAAPTCCCSTSRPTTSTPTPAHRLYDVVDGWTPLAARGQPRPRAARADGPDRRPARRRGALVRRRLLVVRRPGRGRAGGRRAGGQQRRGPTYAVSATTGSRPSGCSPAGADRRRRPRRRAGLGKAAINAKRNQAEKSAAKYRNVHEDRLEQARERLDAAESRLREDREIRIDLPGTEVPRGPGGAATATTWRSAARTGSRVVGPNGSGKTTLLHRLVDQAQVPVALLPQRLDVLDDDLTRLRQRRGRGTRRRAQRGARPAGPLPLPGRGRRPAGRRPVRAASGSGRRWPRCCWPTRRPSCCCSTSRPTTSTSRRTTPWSRRSTPTAARWSWSATTRRSSRTSASTRVVDLGSVAGDD